MSPDVFGQVGGQYLFVSCAPEEDDRFNKGDDQIAGLHVALLAEKVDQLVAALVDFIKLGGDLPQ